MKSLFLLGGFLIIYQQAYAQGCFPDNADTTITLSCSENCTDLRFTIPDLRQTTEYKVLDIPYTPLPFTDSRVTGISFSGAWPGNSYSQLQDIGFNFCFFNAVYNTLAVGSNGTVTFDASMANGWCDPFLKRGPTTFPLPNIRYPSTLIAAVMHDLDPGDTARVSSNLKIELRVEGDAPCRKAVISFFQVPLWPGPQRNCHTFGTNTHQIILYEGTGIIDVFVKDSPQCPGSNEGYNTLGIQNLATNTAVTPRNKNCTQWGGSNLNLGYRFLPSGGNSQLLSARLILNGRDYGSGVVTPGPTDGELTVSFPGICPSAATNVCVLQAVYNSCTGTGTIDLFDTIYINKTNSLNATARAEAALCSSATGSISVDVPVGMGVPPIQFSLNGGPPQTSPVFSNLAPGVYSIIVSDASICRDTVVVTVESVNMLNVTLTANNTSCNLSNDGSIQVDAGLAVPPVQYSLNGGPPQASSTFANLAAGVYFVAVTDAAGCTSANNRIEILPGPPLAASYTKTDITCYGSADGTITINQPLNGTAPFGYSLDGVNYQVANVFTGLGPGVYLVRFRDVNGCTGELNVILAQPGRLGGSVILSNVRCNGQSDATISVSAIGGNPPYSYSLDGLTFQTQSDFNVPAGTYNVYINDSKGCRHTLSNIVITEPAILTASAVSTSATCDGGNDGTITISANGGVSGYVYSIDGLNFQPSNVFNVGPGTYDLVVKDANGCSTFVTGVGVQLTNNLTLAVSPDEDICEGSSVQLRTTSNAAAYTWSPATGLDNAAAANPTASPQTTTEYTVTATLGHCTAEDKITVSIRPAPVANAGLDGDICVGQSFQLQGTGGNDFEWVPATYLDNPASASPVSVPNQTIQYSLHVTGANGCRSIAPDVVTVRVTPPIKVTVFPSDTIAYTGDQFQLQAISAGTSYVWSPSAGLSNPAIANPILTVSNTGDLLVFTVTATTTAGCTGVGYAKVHVYNGPELYVPTGFTPNNDGKNDRLYPIPVGIRELKYFRVYNRWGQLVFGTTRMNDGWDGRFGGKQEASGVYTWMVQGIAKDNRVITRQGTVMLIR